MASNLSFQPLLFGGDINVYSVARAFHEAYGVKSIAYGKFHTFPCAFSAIIVQALYIPIKKALNK